MGDTRHPNSSPNGTLFLDKVDQDSYGGGPVTAMAPFGAKVLDGPSRRGTAGETMNGTVLSSGSHTADGEGTTRWTMQQRRDLFSAPYDYAVVEGADEADAFARGKAGEAVPLTEVAPRVPVIDVFRWGEGGRVIACHLEREWSEAFFGRVDGWEPGDAAGIVLRLTDALSDGRVRRDRVPLILRSLTDPDEVLDANHGDGIGHVDLGDDPEFVKVCVRAMAICWMDEAPMDALGVFELPKAAGSDLRRFLFFGRSGGGC